METNFKYKLQTFLIATVVAIILSGCATGSDYNKTDRNETFKPHVYRLHNYTFDY